jgi:DNA anti-recombination protein RmuC
MRTTVEIRDDQRAKLLDLAAQRGEKGFSRIVEEALDEYLGARSGRGERVRRALHAIGSLDSDAAERLEENARRIRATWR